MTTITNSTDFDQINVDQYLWPITIEGGAANAPIVIRFKSNITFTSELNYFIINTEYVKFKGKHHNIYIANVPNYPGLIKNGGWDDVNALPVAGFSNIIVRDINLIASNAQLDNNYNGWLCQAYFSIQAINNFVIKCSVKADVNSDYSGGICGTTAGGYNGYLTFEECIYCGQILGYECGGIVSNSSIFNGGTLIITNCIVNAVIYGEGCGGFVGPYACDTDGTNPIPGFAIKNKGLRDIQEIPVSPNNQTITITKSIFNGKIELPTDFVLNYNIPDFYGSSGFVAPFSAVSSNSVINIYESAFNGDINRNYSAGFIGYKSGNYGAINLVECLCNGNINSINYIIPTYANVIKPKSLFALGYSAGFIGLKCGIYGNISVQDCKYNGYIGQYGSAGIVGANGVSNLDYNSTDQNPTGSLFVSKCVMTGIISGDYIGGLIGPDLGYWTDSVSYVNNGKFVMQDCVFAGEIGGCYSAGLIAGATDYPNNILTSWTLDNYTIKNCKSKCNVNDETCTPLVGPGLPENFYITTNSYNNIVVSTYDYGNDCDITPPI